MLNIHLIILAFIQGVTEFLPVSSSAHLALMPQIMGWSDQGIAMDVAMHLGTLLAVIIYFFKDFIRLIKGTLFFNLKTSESQLVAKLFIAMLPALIFGYFIYEHLEEFRSLRNIALLLIFFGLLLYLADKFSPNKKSMSNISYKQAFMIGLAQSIALMPGVSRSGATMTMARCFGINRIDSAKFSMLLAIPTIIAASCWTFYQAYINKVAFNYELLIAIGYSCFFGLIAIWILMKMLQKCSFAVFFGYRLVLGLILLAFSYQLL